MDLNILIPRHILKFDPVGIVISAHKRVVASAVAAGQAASHAVWAEVGEVAATDRAVGVN